MRITYPLGWQNFTREQRAAWWSRNVEKPMQEVMAVAEREGGLENVKPEMLNSAFDKPKTLSEELASIRAVFGAGERERRREARKWNSDLEED